MSQDTLLGVVIRDRSSHMSQDTLLGVLVRDQSSHMSQDSLLGILIRDQLSHGSQDSLPERSLALDAKPDGVKKPCFPCQEGGYWPQAVHLL